MDLLTVTCERDLPQMILQAESISKFVKSCRHWVVINEKTPDIEKWRSLLEPFYTNHDLVLTVPDTYNDSTDSYIGWVRQQVHKILMSKKIKDDYIVLDSKNFFIRPTDTEEWRSELHGNGILNTISKTEQVDFLSTVNYYSKKLGVEPELKHLCPETPFVIKQSVIDNFGDLDKFAEWFIVDHIAVPHSEFLYYSIVAKKHKLLTTNIRHGNSHTFWVGNNCFHYNTHILDNERIKVLGCHIKYLKNLNTDSIYNFNTYLSGIGLTILPLSFFSKEKPKSLFDKVKTFMYS